MVKFCLDYGHGGKDPGAVYKGRKESMDNLDIGKKLGEKLRILGLEVGETRTSDVYTSLKARVDFANRGNYDYFISFHRNAFKPEVGTGVEVFIHPNASPKAAGVARDIQRALVKCGFKNRGVKTANFYVLQKTKMPAILIELGFIDNTMDNQLLDFKKEEIINEVAKVFICRKSK